MQLMTFEASLLQKNYRSKISQSNGACAEQESPVERTSLSTWGRNLMALEPCSPDLPTQGSLQMSASQLCTAQEKAQSLMRLLRHLGTALFQCSINQQDGCAGVTSHMEQPASSIWSTPSFMIQVKTEMVHKTTGALQ